MTRKHFQAIADAVRRGAREAEGEGHDLSAIRHVVIELAYALADTNPNFNRQRFLDACDFSET